MGKDLGRVVGKGSGRVVRKGWGKVVCKEKAKSIVKGIDKVTYAISIRVARGQGIKKGCLEGMT